MARWLAVPPADGELLWRVHKPHELGLAWCGRPIPEGARYVRGLKQCRVCSRLFSEHLALRRKAEEKAARRPSGGSVRAISAGLPGLGRRGR